MTVIRIYHTLGGQYLIHGKEFPMGTVVLQTDNGIEIFCRNFNSARGRKLPVIVYNPIKKKWGWCMMENEYTEFMWDYYRRNKKKINPRAKYKKRYTHKENKHDTRPVTIPKSVRRAMQHPYQGGSVSPR